MELFPSLDMGFDRTASGDLWRHTLSQIPATFGRLVYLSSLRDANTGEYRHFGLAQRYGEAETDRTLRSSHQESFGEWLRGSLEEKKADLDLYLAGIEGDRGAILATWWKLCPYRNLIPVEAAEPERSLFFSDIETLLALLINGRGAVLPDPAA